LSDGEDEELTWEDEGAPDPRQDETLPSDAPRTRADAPETTDRLQGALDRVSQLERANAQLAEEKSALADKVEALTRQVTEHSTQATAPEVPTRSTSQEEVDEMLGSLESKHKQHLLELTREYESKLAVLRNELAALQAERAEGPPNAHPSGVTPEPIDHDDSSAELNVPSKDQAHAPSQHDDAEWEDWS